jgi:hypothetical protein
MMTAPRSGVRTRQTGALLGLLFTLTVPGLALAADESVGVCAAVRGRVDLERAPTSWRAIASGERVMPRDELRSGPRSGLQLLLRDETSFTLGPDSALRVDEFAYEPDADEAKLVANVTKGVFRVVSGKIANEAPDRVRLGAGSATVGVRGSMMAGRVDEVSGETWIVLLGDGAETNTGASPAVIDVCNAGSCVDIRRAGFATRIAGPHAAPTPPFPIDAKDLSAVEAGLAPPPVWALGDEGGDAAGALPQAPADLATEIETETVEDLAIALDGAAFWNENHLVAEASQDARSCQIRRAVRAP